MAGRDVVMAKSSAFGFIVSVDTFFFPGDCDKDIDAPTNIHPMIQHPHSLVPALNYATIRSKELGVILHLTPPLSPFSQIGHLRSRSTLWGQEGRGGVVWVCVCHHITVCVRCASMWLCGTRPTAGTGLPSRRSRTWSLSDFHVRQ